MQYISELKTNNTSPNITIVLPGPCQAKCTFCNWKQDDKISKFIINLDKLLNNLPPNFKQISISGGEPTLSPVFVDVIEMLGKAKQNGKINKVVLTTNGYKLDYDNNIPIMESIVDFINISRHHYSDNLNRKIFNTNNVPDKDELQWIITRCNKIGIEVNLNCVFNEHNKNLNINSLEMFIDFAKDVNANSISFRNQYDDFEPSEVQCELELTHKAKSSCPVCVNKTFIVNGMSIKFHHSSNEPTESKSFSKDETYELILNGNGTLARDWEGKKEVSLESKPIKMSEQKEVRSNTKPYIPEVTVSYSGCGNNYIFQSCGH